MSLDSPGLFGSIRIRCENERSNHKGFRGGIKILKTKILCTQIMRWLGGLFYCFRRFLCGHLCSWDGEPGPFAVSTPFFCLQTLCACRRRHLLFRAPRGSLVSSSPVLRGGLRGPAWGVQPTGTPLPAASMGPSRVLSP